MISNLGKYIPLIFILTFVFIFFDALISFQQIRNVQSDAYEVSRVQSITNEVSTILFQVALVNTQQKKYILTGDKKYLATYLSIWKILNSSTNKLVQDAKGNKNLENSCLMLKKYINEKRINLDNGIAYFESGNMTLSGELLQQEDTINTNTQNLAYTIMNQNKFLLGERQNAFTSTTNEMFTTNILSAALTVLLLILTYLAIMRELRQRTILENKKNEFISLASHELKTPITAMSIFAQILSQRVKKGSRKEAQTIVTRMSTQITEMKNLINDLLDVTRIQLGKLEIEKEIIFLDILVQETIEEIRPTTKKHTITYKDDKSVEIIGDRQRIWQVITNLLNNAIKYSPKGGPITVSLTKRNHVALVSVQDKGMGISKKNLKNIFDRYFREEGNTEKQFSGLGLGLYLSQQIIELHGGKIWAKSTPGKGSTFYFTVPLASNKTTNKKN